MVSNKVSTRNQRFNAARKMLSREIMDIFHNDAKHGMQDDTRNLIGSAIMIVVLKPIKFRLTSGFLPLTSL